MTTRTDTQNRCLHLYCEQLADALNDAGYGVKAFMEIAKPTFEVPWRKESVKELIWRVVQIAMTDKESTTKPTTFEYMKIYDVVDQRVAELTGVHVNWPTEENR